LAKAAPASNTRPPENARPNGWVAAATAAPISTRTAATPISGAVFGANAPQTSSTSAPVARISSG
jgi:hypothetical protein